jgi:hypothetical protein
MDGEVLYTCVRQAWLDSILFGEKDYNVEMSNGWHY